MSYRDNPLQPEILPPEAQVPPPRPAAPGSDPPWSFWDVLRIAIVAVIAIAVFSIVAMSMAAGNAGTGRAAAADLARNPRIIVPAQLSAYLVVIAYMYFVASSGVRRITRYSCSSCQSVVEPYRTLRGARKWEIALWVVGPILVGGAYSIWRRSGARSCPNCGSRAIERIEHQIGKAGGDPLANIRWNWPRFAWPGYLALGVALAILVQTASVLLPIPKTLPIDKYFRDPLGAYLMAGFGISIAPLVEELFFRGFLYPVVARRWGVSSGIVLTAALFAFIHESQLAHAWAPLLLLFLVGLVLTAVRARALSVGASFLIHVGYNATLFTMLYIASDHFRHLERVT